jgi:hypothetical protein
MENIAPRACEVNSEEALCKKTKSSSAPGNLQPGDERTKPVFHYFAAGAAKTSLLRPGSTFGLGLGAFLVSLRPLSLFPMRKVCHKEGRLAKRKEADTCKSVSF